MFPLDGFRYDRSCHLARFARNRGECPALWRGHRPAGGYVRPRLATICLGIFLGLLGTGVGLASPLATKWVLDTLGTPGALARPVTILIALLAVGSIAYLAQAVVLGRLAENIVLDARTSLIQRFFRAHLEDIRAFKTGELVTRVTSDTVLLREAAATSVVQIVNGTVSLIGTVVLMAVLDLPLLGTTLAALAIITILGLGAWRVSSGELAVSTLVAFLLYASNIVDPVTTLADAFASLQSGLAAAARIRETEHLTLEDMSRSTPRSACTRASPRP